MMGALANFALPKKMLRINKFSCTDWSFVGVAPMIKANYSSGLSWLSDFST